MTGPRTAPDEIVLLKLGGSLITDKRMPDTVRQDVLERLAAEIGQALGEPSPGRRGLVLGHGSGSFGHAAARRHRVHEGVRAGERSRLAGISETQERAAALHRLVLEALCGAGLAPFSVAPSSAMVAAGGHAVDFAAEPVARALDLGLLPVVFGDVVMDREQGCAICSTETVLLALERQLAARQLRTCCALWAGATPGVLDAAASPIATLTPSTATDALAAAGGAAGTDVTGGMLHRLEATLTLARRGVPSVIFDGREPGALGRALARALGRDSVPADPLREATDPHDPHVGETRVLPDALDR